MEVKKVLKIIEEIYPLLPLWKDDLDNLITLLQSLEFTIKGCETAYIKAVLEKDKIRKELEAYKGIVGEIENDFGNGILQNENGFGVKLEHLIEIKKQKYFGGGE